MEYASRGDLLQYVKGKGKLTEAETRTIFKQIVYGLAYIHSKSVLHRDIKLDNILLDETMHAKICDFGVSKIISRSQVIEEQCGTPAYLAPEIVRNEAYHGFYADHWSLGIVLYAMACAAVPYKAENLDQLRKVLESSPLIFPCRLSPELTNLIRGLVCLEPEARLSLPEVLAHPWVRYGASDDLLLASAGEAEEADAEPEAAEPDEEQEANINVVNVKNLFYTSGSATTTNSQLSMKDYQRITIGYNAQDLDEDTLDQVAQFGYSRDLVETALRSGQINHATATYYLLLSDKLAAVT